MSVTASTPQQICNSPLNTSTSKMLFSFPKAPKFGVDPKPACAHAFYDLPPLKETRAPGFGYGTRSDFTSSQLQTPAPNNYKPADSFIPDKKKGFSFGLSREKMQITGGMFVGDKNSPGPGAYDTREANKVMVAYTFKSRTASGDGLTTRRHVPGPGTYPVYDTITPNGKLFNSKYKNSGAPTISPAKSARFPDLRESKVPGPGAYVTAVGISPTGEYVLSKFKASLGRSFGHGGMRSSSSQPSLSKVPGPGSYRVPSDFGHYEAASFHKAPLDQSGAKTERKTRGAASGQVTPRKLE